MVEAKFQKTVNVDLWNTLIMLSLFIKQIHNRLYKYCFWQSSWNLIEICTSVSYLVLVLVGQRSRSLFLNRESASYHLMWFSLSFIQSLFLIMPCLRFFKSVFKLYKDCLIVYGIQLNFVTLVTDDIINRESFSCHLKTNYSAHRLQLVWK